MLVGGHFWILGFNFRGRTDNCHEMALVLVSGADFKFVPHHFSTRARLAGSWGQVWLESGRQSTKPKSQVLVSLSECHTVCVRHQQVTPVHAGVPRVPATELAPRGVVSPPRRQGASQGLRGLYGGVESGRSRKGVDVWSVFGQTWPRDPSRATGFVLQCRLHQKAAP